MNQIRDHVMNGKLEAAKILCAQTDSPVARLTEKGVSRIGKPLDDINTAIENAGTLEVYKLEKKCEYSCYCSRCSANDRIPWNRDWYDFWHSIKWRAAEGQAEMGALASGIYTAMTTTVAGLGGWVLLPIWVTTIWLTEQIRWSIRWRQMPWNF